MAGQRDTETKIRKQSDELLRTNGARFVSSSGLCGLLGESETQCGSGRPPWQGGRRLRNRTLRLRLEEVPRADGALRANPLELKPVGSTVEQLLEAGMKVYSMNSKSAKSYRERKAPSGAKDDWLDA